MKTVLTNCNLINRVSDSPMARATVVIENGRISEVLAGQKDTQFFLQVKSLAPSLSPTPTRLRPQSNLVDVLLRSAPGPSEHQALAGTSLRILTAR